MTSMRDYKLKTNSIGIQIQEYEKNGPPVLFLHFGGANLNMWQPSLPYFTNNYHVILIDLRGHGKSDKPKEGYHLDDMAEDILGILNSLEIEKINIIGCSIGAEVAIYFGAKYPKRINFIVCEGALTSESGPYGVYQGTDVEFEKYVQKQIEEKLNSPEDIYNSTQEYFTVVQNSYENFGIWNENIKALVDYDLCKLSDKTYGKSWRKWAKIGYYRHYYYYRFEEYFQELQCPVLMMITEGELNDPISDPIIRKMLNVPQFGITQEVSGDNHPYEWLLEPEKMSSLILPYLSEYAK